MAIPAPVLWGWTLASLSEFEDGVSYRGGTTTMANGSDVVDLVASNSPKRNFLLTWSAVTAAQKGDIRTAYNGTVVSGSASFTGPDSVTCTVTVADIAEGFTCKARRISSGLRWDITMKLKEL